MDSKTDEEIAELRAKVNQKRRKLSVFSSGNKRLAPTLLDGVAKEGTPQQSDNLIGSSVKGSIIKEFAVKSQVGHVPFNNQKVNQDRAIAEPKCGLDGNCSVFGCFDGHGIRGEDVSTFIVNNLMKTVNKTANFQKNVQTQGWIDVFEDLTTKLALSSVNCAFSGTTAVVSWIGDGFITTANLGDSRAVLGRMTDGKLTAIALSVDQKPDDPEEKERILDMNGRVEPCKGVLGDPIGPHRVWLRNQDMPGLAMSRSFGDDVATSVGVISTPEINVTKFTPQDRLIVWGSDGLWEFIENQECLDLIKDVTSSQEAVKRLSHEATRRWKKEEEVIDDITVVVAFLASPTQE